MSITLDTLITKDTPTNEIVKLLTEISYKLDKLKYEDNIKEYNYLWQRKSNLINIIDSRTKI